MSLHAKILSLVLLVLGCAAPAVPAQDSDVAPDKDTDRRATLRFGDPLDLAYSAPFFPGANYDTAIPTPDSILGQMHGTRLSHPAEIVECFRAWAEASPRVTVATHGQTHEGRELIHAVITSENNHARLDEILANLERLHQGASEADTRTIAESTPPVAWMGYSIHGDELSGCDAGVALGYHLTASTDAEVTALLDDLVVVIDPCMNPDGRERIISMVEQSAGYTTNLDYASMHRGRWPYGRGNHYLFDMNRDWMVGTQPETQGRWAVVQRYHPQLFVDAHEMGSLDTFLLYPQEKPLNPFFPEKHAYWHGEFAADASSAFDSHGWGYYTREWADGWAPFYSDAWSSLIGAIGILYEQAGVYGFPLRRASGEVMTYRETVHHQLTASMANLTTLAERGDEVLSDYAANKRRNIAEDTPGNDRMFVMVPGRNPSRERELLRILVSQGVECYRAEEAFVGTNAEGAIGQRESEVDFAAGTVLVPARQPLGQIVKAYLTFDLRLDLDALRAEREELEQTGSTKIYDLTAWSLAHALDVDAWWCDAVEVDRAAFEAAPEAPAGGVFPTDASPYAWVVDSGDDAALAFAVRAMELGLQVHVSDKEFTTGGNTFPRGSLLVRRHENEGTPAEVGGKVNRAARAAGVTAFVTGTGRSPDSGPDLGGGHFELLARPRVAVLANSPVRSDTYGHLWHHLDTRLGVPFTLLDAQEFGRADLRRYNVLVLPPGSSSTLREHAEEIGAWTEAGGTLIAIDDAAATAISSELSSAKLRRNALDELDDYAEAAERERAAYRVDIDEVAVWDGVSKPIEADADTGDASAEEKEAEAKAPTPEDDAWARTFSPYGVNLLAEVHPRHWITAGFGELTPVYFSGSRVFLAKSPVTTAIRLTGADELRLGGLVWPEARERIADSAWLTVESRGNGQVILFAAMPAFRGYQVASARLLGNAVVLGPGLGASQPLGW